MAESTPEDQRAGAVGDEVDGGVVPVATNFAQQIGEGGGLFGERPAGTARGLIPKVPNVALGAAADR